MRLADLPTPSLVLDLDVLERNLERMARRAAGLGVALRPHVKTHKCLEIGERQRALGARGITVATLEEARTFADAGFDDITWAFPLIIGRLEEAAALGERVRLGVTVDSPEAVAALESGGAGLGVWLKVDCGYRRAGVDPSGDVGAELARSLAAAPRLDFRGILTHSGQAYAARGGAALAAAAEEERAVMVTYAERLRSAGVRVPEVSVGSTPAMSAALGLAGVSEARPGNYAFYDASQVERGACGVEECALSVLATVVSCRPGGTHAVVDAGALALSKDAGAGGTGMGLLLDLDGLALGGRLTALSQEHGIVDRPFAVGTRVRVLANHSCLAAACFDRYRVVRGEKVVGEWKVHRQRA